MSGKPSIQIAEIQFVLDEQWQQFNQVGEGRYSIPLSQVRYYKNDWFILWNKQQNRCYDTAGLPAGATIPLSVEWTKITVLNSEQEWKEKMDLLILLSETMKKLRTGNSRVIKHVSKLKLVLSQFNTD